ncbi:hypothetical protein IE077_001911 [Cardiosporidium cionae]|uniref:Uncharacterized protein n=1 Tax=Cardiosporidium cionae TaxID=476202 RepID=A0ABQ7JC01_9APIC|nr:hypothetical protein IE077_001911 [Cardiosporidium cionae]|eukprot:KAF8821541.1 hypothetical protein IE077_001911 [Cardiosporidium cionae]
MHRRAGQRLRPKWDDSISDLDVYRPTRTDILSKKLRGISKFHSSASVEYRKRLEYMRDDIRPFVKEYNVKFKSEHAISQEFDVSPSSSLKYHSPTPSPRGWNRSPSAFSNEGSMTERHISSSQRMLNPPLIQLSKRDSVHLSRKEKRDRRRQKQRGTVDDPSLSSPIISFDCEINEELNPCLEGTDGGEFSSFTDTAISPRPLRNSGGCRPVLAYDASTPTVDIAAEYQLFENTIDELNSILQLTHVTSLKSKDYSEQCISSPLKKSSMPSSNLQEMALWNQAETLPSSVLDEATPVSPPLSSDGNIKALADIQDFLNNFSLFSPVVLPHQETAPDSTSLHASSPHILPPPPLSWKKAEGQPLLPYAGSGTLPTASASHSNVEYPKTVAPSTLYPSSPPRMEDFFLSEKEGMAVSSSTPSDGPVRRKTFVRLTSSSQKMIGEKQSQKPTEMKGADLPLSNSATEEEDAKGQAISSGTELMPSSVIEKPTLATLVEKQSQNLLSEFDSLYDNFPPINQN